MNNVYIIGDMHTVSAFRLAGVRGVVSNDQPNKIVKINPDFAMEAGECGLCSRAD